MRTIRVAMTQKERRTLLKVLNAAGEVLVTRAMTRVCTLNYDNRGWHNCFFTQMFGGKANLDRMAEAYLRSQGDEYGVIGNKNDYDAYYESAIAQKLGGRVTSSDISLVTVLFDSGTGFKYGEDETTIEALRYGKVVAMLNYVERWLLKRGIDVSPFTLDAHVVV